MATPDTDMSMMKAVAHAAIGEGQDRVRAFRDEARLLALIQDRRILLLLLEPGQLARQLFAFSMGNRKIEQEAAGDRVADVSVEPTKITEIGRQAIADLSDHRHRDHRSRPYRQGGQRHRAGGCAGRG